MPELNKSLFTQVKGEVLFDTDLSAGAYRFLNVVLYLTGSNTHCWYSQIELARIMGLKGKQSDRSIRKWSKECEDKKYIRVERPGYHKPNKYYPLVKVPPQGKKLSTEKAELSTPNHPPVEDRNQITPKDRNQKEVKLHTTNYIQHDRVSNPKDKKIKPPINWAKYEPGAKYGFLTAPSGF